MADTVNERLHDVAINHAIDLQHYSNGVLRRVMATLNRADAALFQELLKALDRLPAESFTVQRLETLLYSVRSLNKAAFDAVAKELTDDMRDLVHYEGEFQYKAFDATLPDVVVAQIGIAPVATEQVYAAALARPFQGVLLRGVPDDLEATRAKRIRETIAQGYVSNKSTDQIVRDLRGTRSLQYEDGVFARSRREVESVTRTAVGHFAAFTRDRFMQQNAPLVKALQWVSVLDNRTSQMCRIRDGLEYTRDAHKPIGHSIPWLAGPGNLHWCCRSTSTPVVKSWRELGIPVDDFTPTTRASMDGQVPAETTYGDWLRKQSAARQDEILGPTRGQLFRAGGLDLNGFYNNQGRFLTLDELRQRDAAAFRKAGVDA
jgi:SPP1 gp7 family putative phage head morphogenesis protein